MILTSFGGLGFGYKCYVLGRHFSELINFAYRVGVNVNESSG